MNRSSERPLPCCGFSVLESSLGSSEGSAQGMSTSAAQSCLRQHQELEPRWAEGAVLQKSALERAECLLCLLPEVWEPRHRMAQKSAPCPGLSRILQHLASQRRAGFLPRGWLFPPAVFSALLLGLTCHPRTAEPLEPSSSPQSSCSLMKMYLGKVLLLVLMAMKVQFI